ncbi:hypothetical protein M432DRAFT_86867 [Thermoascus aurantiacus ATCC 26904]
MKRGPIWWPWITTVTTLSTSCFLRTITSITKTSTGRLCPYLSRKPLPLFIRRTRRDTNPSITPSREDESGHVNCSSTPVPTLWSPIPRATRPSTILRRRGSRQRRQTTGFRSSRSSWTWASTSTPGTIAARPPCSSTSRPSARTSGGTVPPTGITLALSRPPGRTSLRRTTREKPCCM